MAELMTRPITEHSPCVVEELLPAPEIEAAFLRLAKLPHCLFLDSARRDPQLGRYSFVAADPFEYLETPVCDFAAAGDPFTRIQRRLAGLATPPIEGLPPFQGGAAGLFSYDLGGQLERLPSPRFDEFQAPGVAIGLYDAVVAFDHVANRAWIISQGFPETDAERRRERAVERLLFFRQHVLSEPQHKSNGRSASRNASGLASAAKDLQEQTEETEGHSDSHVPTVSSVHSRSFNEPRGDIATTELAPQFDVERFSSSAAARLTSNFSPENYLTAVRRAIEYIRAGDVFQVNFAQRLLHPASDDSVSLYLRLRRRNPATFAGYFDLGEFQIASASPERFLQVRDREVEARPIKGTRRRTARPEADLFTGDELRESEKDNAENVMIVDLLRNDLSRVCRPESVVVSDLCRLESYEFVQHLVSVVRGRLRDGVGPLDLLRTAFPGGSVTGAPKVRAMEIIAELEPTARGPYCGALGYIGFDGTMDTNILIRTITAGRGWWQMPVGGGIVAQSDPQAEYEETWQKAEGLIRAIS